MDYDPHRGLEGSAEPNNTTEAIGFPTWGVVMGTMFYFIILIWSVVTAVRPWRIPLPNGFYLNKKLLLLFLTAFELGLVSIAYVAPDIYVNGWYKETNCTVLDRGEDTYTSSFLDGDLHRAELKVQYYPDNSDELIETIGYFCASRCYTIKTTEHILDEYPLHQNASCFYNPLEKGRVVMKKEFAGEKIAILLLGLIIPFVISLAIVGACLGDLEMQRDMLLALRAAERREREEAEADEIDKEKEEARRAAEEERQNRAKERRDRRRRKRPDKRGGARNQPQDIQMAAIEETPNVAREEEIEPARGPGMDMGGMLIGQTDMTPMNEMLNAIPDGMGGLMPVGDGMYDPTMMLGGQDAGFGYDNGMGGEQYNSGAFVNFATADSAQPINLDVNLDALDVNITESVPDYTSGSDTTYATGFGSGMASPAMEVDTALDGLDVNALDLDLDPTINDAVLAGQASSEFSSHNSGAFLMDPAAMAMPGLTPQSPMNMNMGGQQPMPYMSPGMMDGAGVAGNMQAWDQNNQF